MTAFILACIFIELTPGPNMAYLTITSINAGRRAGLITVGGITVGLSIIALASALGAAEAIIHYPVVYEFIRWAGVLYLFWLAYLCLQENRDLTPKHAGSRYFRRGLIINLLNPKAAAFYLTVLPGFIDISHDILPQTLLMTLISITIATIAHILIVIFASKLQPYVSAPHKHRMMRMIFAGLLAAVAIWFAVATGA
jgi:threonine/homoserine/homoserine lactone efflux protein